MTPADKILTILMIICLAILIYANSVNIQKLQDSQEEAIENKIRNMVIDDYLYDKLHYMEAQDEISD